MIIKAEDYFDKLNPYLKNLIPLLTVKSIEEYREIIKEVKIAEFIYTDNIMNHKLASSVGEPCEPKTFRRGEASEHIQRAKQINPDLIVSIRLPMNKDSDYIVDELARSGAEIIHLYADDYGNEPNFSFKKKSSIIRNTEEELINELDTSLRSKNVNPRFIKDVIRGVHLRLVETSIRDEVTIIASGGIALAEHLAKIIICGADLAAIDLPLLIALECRLCKECENSIFACPVEIHNVTPEYAVPRMTNLIGAWHSQLIEVLGAMGLREVRRLRGEVGRAMFYEDLERETFGSVKRDT